MSLPVPIPESSKEKHARYTEYKDTGIEWLGEIPAHWEVKKLKYVCNVRFSGVDKHSRDGEEPIYLCNYTDVYNHKQILPSHPFMEATATKNEIISFSLQKADVIITKDSEDWKDIAVPSYVVEDCPDVICGYHLALIKPFSTSITGSFLYWSFCSRSINYQFMISATGITRFGLGKDDVCDSLLITSPKSEQKTIADYLDQETAKIDQLVEKKKRLIELLEEQRTAIITHAVTKGLNPDVEMKDSGVEWLGEIPAHWDLKKLKHVTTCLDGKRVPLNSEQRGYIQGGYPYWGANGILDYIDNWLFDEQLILLGEDGAPFFEANKTVAFLVEGKIWVNNHAHVLRVLNSTNARFLTNVLNVVQYRQFIEGSTRDKLTQDSMNNIPIQFAPINEQQAIADYLDKETTRIDNLINKINQAIEKLQEYRSALITAAVTGKIDVRQHVS